MVEERIEYKSQSKDLINDVTEWGVSVSDRQAKKTAVSIALKLLSYVLICVAMIMVTPILVGITLVPNSEVIIQYIVITIPLVLAAVLFQMLSRRGPRNALQVDYSACEVRLGSVKSDGTFIRHRVCPFSQIEKVYIDRPKDQKPGLCLQMEKETARISFANADGRSLTLLATQISAARETARKMPLSSRIASTVIGFEASAREVGQRVRSRVVTRTVT